MKVFFRVPNSRTPNPIFVNRARSSKRAGGLIPRIALDQCRVPERYRTRAPFRTPEREVDRAAQPFHFFIEILESAGCESVEETGQGFFLSTEYWSTGALECCKVLRVIHITPLLHYSSTTVSYRGCGLTAECGHAKAETTVQFRSPAPVVQTTCLPLMQDITGAKPVRDANFRRVVRGEQQTHLIQNQAALDVQVVSRRPVRPQSIVSDAFAR